MTAYLVLLFGVPSLSPGTFYSWNGNRNLVPILQIMKERARRYQCLVLRQSDERIFIGTCVSFILG